MTSPIAVLILAAAAQAPAPGIAFSHTVPPPVALPTLPPQSLPPAAIQPPHILRGPQERMPASRYVTPLDYPEALRGSGPYGTVGMLLTIDPAGRVIGCSVTRSSGSRVLDAASCRLLIRRARYTPAMDSNGNPAVGTIEQQIEWKAPRRG
jgi:protein TonB